MEGGISLKKMFIKTTAYKQIGKEVKRFSNLETGGIIMGYATRNSVIITNATGSGPHAVHTHKSLKLDNIFCLLKALRYRKQNKKLKYLGDWHSHPSNILKPSKRDIVTFLRKEKTHYDKSSPIMVITSSLTPVRIRVFTPFRKKIVSATPKLIP